MGVKSALSLEEANRLFEGRRFERLEATTDGIIDTTYIARSGATAYILKKYEEAGRERIEAERALLERFSRCGITVPSHLASSGEWHLYSCLKGRKVTQVNHLHLQSVARTLARMHRCTHSGHRPIFDPEETALQLRRLRAKEYSSYVRLHRLRDYRPKREGVIHGDLFTDNALFDGGRIGVIDFIDAGEGSFAFDLGVAALDWALRGRNLGYLRRFLRAYNQHAPRKIALHKLIGEIKNAAAFYTLSRIDKKVRSAAHQKALLKRTRHLEWSHPC
ncbi:phosphotransferase [Sulfurimonas sp. HSL3-7]|uniref:phosphotransferase n=1 Tax=Sulfonitrofixus jiaomeiensis TaxID=3131938 RepID=UPI0031F8F3B2